MREIGSVSTSYMTGLKWINFCIEQEIDYLQPPLELALAFLTKNFMDGLSYSALNTGRRALSSLITLRNGTRFGGHLLVTIDS